MKRLLVTGFGPFPGIRANPSAALARRIAADLRLSRHGIAVSTLLIPTTYADADRIVARLAADAPDAVLMLGVAGRRKAITPEFWARNRVSVLAPDASGRRPSRLTIGAQKPATLRGRANVPLLVAAGQGCGVPVSMSRHAGAYLCNYAYWRMLEALPPSTHCVFVHVPRLPRSRLAMAANSLAAIARRLVHARV